MPPIFHSLQLCISFLSDFFSPCATRSYAVVRASLQPLLYRLGAAAHLFMMISDVNNLHTTMDTLLCVTFRVLEFVHNSQSNILMKKNII